MHQAQTCCDCKPTSPCTNASPCSIFASHVLQGLPEASASGSRRAKSEPVYLHHVTTVRGADNSHGSAPVLLRQKTPASTATANRAGRMRGRPALSCHDRCRPDTHYRAGRLHCCNFSRCTLHLLQIYANVPHQAIPNRTRWAALKHSITLLPGEPFADRTVGRRSVLSPTHAVLRQHPTYLCCHNQSSRLTDISRRPHEEANV